MKPIGGFFELDLPDGDSFYHNEAMSLSTGRACLGFLIEALAPSKIYLPYYCCEALFEPLKERNIDFDFYKINESLELAQQIELQKGEYLIYINYFGLKDKYIKTLLEQYKDQFILDNTHAFFQKQKGIGYSFTSARKYFGVADGAFLYGLNNTDTYDDLPRFTKASVAHSVNRLMGNQQEAFALFQQYEQSLDCSVLRISVLSEKLLSAIDYKSVRAKRAANFAFLSKELNDINGLQFDHEIEDAFCYPFLPKKSMSKTDFYAEKIYVPTLWPDVLERSDVKKYPIAENLTKELLPLPIDHRYSHVDMERMAAFIRSQL